VSSGTANPRLPARVVNEVRQPARRGSGWLAGVRIETTTSASIEIGSRAVGPAPATFQLTVTGVVSPNFCDECQISSQCKALDALAVEKQPATERGSLQPAIGVFERVPVMS